MGELVWDVLPDRRFPGGAPANFAFHVGSLGGRGVVVSAVSNDAAGTDLLAWLRDVGVEDRYVQTSPLPTGRVSVDIDGRGHPRYLIHTNVAWDAIEWNDRLAALAVEADCVCVGTLSQRSAISRATVLRFLAATRPACLRIFDVNLRDPHCDAEVLRETLPLANLLKLNDAEYPFLAKHMALDPDPLVGLRTLADRTDLKWIALTRGGDGSVVFDRQAAHELAGEPVDVADTIGAGDAFTATLAMGLLRGDDVATVQRNAAAVANYVCTQPGATPTLPPALLERVRRQPTASASVSLHLTDLVAAMSRRSAAAPSTAV